MDDPSADTPPAQERERTEGTQEQPRSLTVRAVLLAFVLAILAAFISDYHDGIIIKWEVCQQNYASPLVIGLFFGFLAGINSVLRRFARRMALSAGELAIVLMLALLTNPIPRYFAATWVGSVGFTQALMDTRDERVKALTKANLYAALPEGALLDSAASRQFDDGWRRESARWPACPACRGRCGCGRCSSGRHCSSASWRSPPAWAMRSTGSGPSGN
jgi:F0F1-type ATP synthase assembly protein I